jgi:hypothetical protein
MSKDMNTSEGESSSSERAFLIEMCIAKLPQPGHHVGAFFEL